MKSRVIFRSMRPRKRWIYLLFSPVAGPESLGGTGPTAGMEFALGRDITAQSVFMVTILMSRLLMNTRMKKTQKSLIGRRDAWRMIIRLYIKLVRLTDGLNWDGYSREIDQIK